MGTYIALLRAVNVAGHQSVPMRDLRDLAARLGFSDPRTVVQSGNLVFHAAAQPTARLESKLETALRGELALDTDVMVRTARQWAQVLGRNPFRTAAARDPGRLLVVVLKRAPTRAAVRALQDAISGRERLQVAGRQAYVVYPDGMGRSRLAGALIERHLATRGTARNWNTVRKLTDFVALPR